VLHAARVPRRECPWGRGHIEDKIPREVTEVEAAAYKARMQNAETGASCVVAARPTQRRACAGDTATACAGIKLGVHGIIHKHADSFTGAEMVTWCVHTPRVRAPSCPIAGGANVRTCVYRLVQADKLMHRSRAVRLGEALLARGAAGSSAARSASWGLTPDAGVFKGKASFGDNSDVFTFWRTMPVTMAHTRARDKGWHCSNMFTVSWIVSSAVVNRMASRF
jgi:hypothetical protein